MRHKLMVGVLCTGLAACAIAPPAPLPPPTSVSLPKPLQAASSGDLAAERQACNTAYPPKIGNYLPHAECVNTAVERYAIPYAPYPDLVRLQEELRINYSAQIDNGSITPQTGEAKMGKADELIASAITERDAGRAGVADNQVIGLQTALQQH
jgi:hypothetical protein